MQGNSNTDRAFPYTINQTPKSILYHQSIFLG